MVLKSFKHLMRQTFPRRFWAGVLLGLSLAYLCVNLNLLASSSSSFAPVSKLGRTRPAEDSSITGTLRRGPDDVLIQKLKEEVKVLIWVMTSPRTLADRASVVRETWGKRVDKLLFFSSTPNETFTAIGLNVSEGRDHLTAKTMRGFQYIYAHHLEDADWFMKVDDDTFVIVENLLYFLSEENATEPVYFGHHFGLVAAQGYYSGGGVYVLSKEALVRFGKQGSNSSVCKQDGGAEDAEFGKCMEKLGVKTVNTTDSLGHSRFHCFDPETFIEGGFPRWYRKYDANGARKGLYTLSDYAITFHYIYPEKMQRLQYYIYHLAPFGISRGLRKLNKAPEQRVPIRPIYRLPPYAPVGKKHL